MKIFVINCGSSSIKYQLFDMAGRQVRARGLLERVGTGRASLTHVTEAGKRIERVCAADHTDGIRVILEMLVNPTIGVIRGIDEINGVGHRVVHGGEDLTASALIDDAVLAAIRRCVSLAPLHNPANLMGIEAARKAMPSVPHVAVFDTAFLSTLPPVAYRYAVPREWYTRHGVRRYGFHGTSHRYVAARAAELLGKKPAQVNLITVHLGNGCSMTAVARGKAVDHSMGLTPLEGLVMGTRCGDIDPAIVLFMQAHGLSAGQVDEAMNKRSGLLGLSGVSNDMRDLLAAAEKGNADAELAVSMFVYRIVKYIGAYSAILPALDAVVLTGGIGENSVPVRLRICRFLRRMGVALSDRRNARTVGGKEGPVTAKDSPLAVWVIPTNEELMIAQDTERIVRSKGRLR